MNREVSSIVPAPRRLTLCTLLLVSALPLDAALIHRWSFNAAAGGAPDGTTSPQLAGPGAAVVRGAGAQFTGNAIMIPGGPSTSAAYVDLPNNLISVLTDCTIEGWVSVNAGVNAWGRIFDFGDSLGAEVLGVGGGGEGRDYLELSASRGADYNVQRLEWRNETPAGGGISTADSGVVTTFGQSFHFAVTVDADGLGGSTLNYWRNGAQLTTNFATALELADLNDVNNWLGRSNWTGDANVAASFDEFRIYSTALSGPEIEASRLAGPDAFIIPEPSAAMLLGLAAVAARRRRRRL